ncbi:LodA/GoxA family CTQ-dependent oxidase [Corallococcus llansteffanensis]|uniref:Catalase n=1 Tax=Corallococcus llansteffanensis TaxID=2316731 RepID=A0A3A8QSZ7_9BACT|nr:LodA/GoxA family CTQ-dependent oxidase [Corallococcus llansteffanensis]RKH66254.1 hypothetical protein D7V93_04605 [Corallococcus llansteffanensis]
MSRHEKDAPPDSFDCEGQPTERLVEMFVRMTQENRIRLGQTPAERAVFRKLHGVAHGHFEILPGVDRKLRTGIFAQDRLEAWVRFSSDTSPTLPDLGSTLGVGIKLFGVAGSNGLGESGTTADFILQNFPRFFVQDAKAMCEFTYAGVVLKDYPGYLKQHPATQAVLDAMTAPQGSVLTSTYWAILPFKLGKEVVKYRLEPETAPQNVPDDADDYLATDLATRLARDGYRFRFMIQRRTHPSTMPLDRAMDDWSEKQSPFVQIATLVLPRQDIGERGQADYGQSLSFNIWRTPPENAPSEASSIAVVRKAVYAAGAAARHRANGQPLKDLPEPRPVAPKPKAPDEGIVKAVIYPPIGIARVGSSPDGYFIGPEVTEPPAQDKGFYRDAQGRLKRQAARFRIYGVNAEGHIIRELSVPKSGAKVRWTVQLANTKAAWYGFQLALDIPEASSAPPTTLRNAAVADRSRLAITPATQSVQGAKARPKRFDGTFMDLEVHLGEIRTDECGRLVVLGGHGVSRSCDGTYAITFANNEGWHDDVSDGPVTAEVVLDGKPLEVVPAWVVVAPPNYGPQRKSVRTMWDLMRDVAIRAGTLAAPARPSFTHDILPLFQRLAGLQWVNAGFAAGFGWKGMFDFTDPEVLARLGDSGPAEREYRHAVANQFRNFARDSWSPTPWPWLYGDAMNIPPAQTPRQYTALTDTQLAMLQQWALGEFVADHDPNRKPPATLAEVPLPEQGDMLTRAALEFCLADAFHPGCEMTWPMRQATMYLQPFRLAHQLPGWKEPNLGEVITLDSITLANGPLTGQPPGGLTRWMAVPWQADSASCRSGYDTTYDPYVPSFWPARVPNEVLTEENYRIVMDTKKPLAERRAAFANRAAWINPLGSTSYTDQINNMIQHFDHLGVVEARKGPTDTDAFPAVIEVEDQHKPIQDVIPPEARVRRRGTATGSSVGVHHREAPSAAKVDVRGIEKVRRFPGGLRR